MLQPALLIVSEIRNGILRPALRASHYIQTRVGRDSCQPALERATTFEASKLRVCFQKNVLRRFFDQSSLSKETARHTKYARAVTSHDLRKGRLVAILRLPRQVQVQGLFEPTRQLQSSFGLRMADSSTTRIRQLRGGDATDCRFCAFRHVGF